MRILVALILACFITLPGNAARDPATAARQTNLELLVFEAEACRYCAAFRIDTAPRYGSSPAAARAPLRFVDIANVDIDTIGLQGRLTMLPTVVLMRDGREIDRITGYTGSEAFLTLVHRLLRRAE